MAVFRFFTIFGYYLQKDAKHCRQKKDFKDNCGFKIGDKVTREMIGEGIVKDIVIKQVAGYDKDGNSVTELAMLVLEFDNGLTIEAPAINAKYIGIEKCEQ